MELFGRRRWRLKAHICPIVDLIWLVCALDALSLLFCIFINTAAYHWADMSLHHPLAVVPPGPSFSLWLLSVSIYLSLSLIVNFFLFPRYKNVLNSSTKWWMFQLCANQITVTLRIIKFNKFWWSFSIGARFSYKFAAKQIKINILLIKSNPVW